MQADPRTLMSGRPNSAHLADLYGMLGATLREQGNYPGAAAASITVLDSSLPNRHGYADSI